MNSRYQVVGFFVCLILVIFGIRFSNVVHCPEDKITNEGLREKTRSYFKDCPILIGIAECESGFNQWDRHGHVLRGRINAMDLGLMQINEYHHKAKAKKLGIDITTVEGNLAYARYLYNREGTRPWRASSKCWRNTIISSRK